MTTNPPYCSRVGCPNPPTHAAAGNRWCRDHMPLDEWLVPISESASGTCIRCDWGTALGTRRLLWTAYCAPCLSILVALERGEQPTVDDPLDAPPERTILLDLIAELREAHQRTGSESAKGSWCDPCALPWPCHTIQSADRAEARLREVR